MPRNHNKYNKNTRKRPFQKSYRGTDQSSYETGNDDYSNNASYYSHNDHHSSYSNNYDDHLQQSFASPVGTLKNTPLGSIINADTSRNALTLPESLTSFLERASSLLSSSESFSSEFQFQFAHTVQQQFVALDDKERLMLLNHPEALPLIERLILWSTSDLFYEFLHANANLWLFMSYGESSSEILKKILLHLQTDMNDDSDHTQKLKAQVHCIKMREALEKAKDLQLFANRNSALFLSHYLRHEIVLRNADEVKRHLEHFEEILKANADWFLGEEPVWIRNFSTCLLESLKLLAETRVESLHGICNALWDSIFGFHVELKERTDSSATSSYKMPKDASSGHILDMCCNKESSMIVKYFFKVGSTSCANAIFGAIFEGKLQKLISYDDGQFVAAAILKAISKDEFARAFAEITDNAPENITQMWGENRKRNTVISLVDGCAKFSIQEKAILKAFKDLAQDTLVNYLLSKRNNPRNRDTHADFDRFGVKLYVALLHFRPSTVKPLLEELEKMHPERFAQLCTDKWGSFVVDEWIKVVYTGSVGNNKRRRLVLEKFQGSVVRAVCNPYGSRVFENLLELSDPSQQVPLLNEYIRGEHECKRSKFARIIFSKYFLRDFKINANHWVSQQKKARKVSNMFSDIFTPKGGEKGTTDKQAAQRKDDAKKEEEEDTELSTTNAEHHQEASSSEEADAQTKKLRKKEKKLRKKEKKAHKKRKRENDDDEEEDTKKSKKRRKKEKKSKKRSD